MTGQSLFLSLFSLIYFLCVYFPSSSSPLFSLFKALTIFFLRTHRNAPWKCKGWKRGRKDADTVDMTPSVLIALFTNTPLPGVLERALWGSSSLLTQTHTHKCFHFLSPPSIHSFIHLCQRKGRRERKKKSSWNQKQQQLLWAARERIRLDFFFLLEQWAKIFKRKKGNYWNWSFWMRDGRNCIETGFLLFLCLFSHGRLGVLHLVSFILGFKTKAFHSVDRFWWWRINSNFRPVNTLKRDSRSIFHA